ncbi:uncharacterized protein LOC116347337 [Contarinia nasturtii]|uniref:uncharacterized protein LOC116347337 n=1 Tax=Contarinia nasturtii TaxID=265458 RepID=UPI0012D37FEA|nr:uncharacterized protein LOC116347337 [Contarinia nasturtii]
MKNLLILMLLSILVDKISGTITYKTIVEKFAEKARKADEGVDVDWKSRLEPLFILCDDVTDNMIEKVLHSYIIINIETPIVNLLKKVPKNSVVTTILAETKHILKVQCDVNKLCTNISRQIRIDSTAVQPIHHPDKVYNAWQKTSLDPLHVRNIEQSLPIMETILEDLHDEFARSMNDVNAAKETFKTNTQKIVNIFNNCIDPKDKLSSLKEIIVRYKQSQELVWNRLKHSEEVLRKYYSQRNAWADILMDNKGYKQH